MSKTVEQVLGFGLIVASFFVPGAIAGSVWLARALMAGLTIAGGALQADAARRTAKSRAESAARQRATPAAITGNVASGDEAHLLVFGEARVGGIVSTVGTSGEQNDVLWFDVLHSICHPGGCEGVTEVWFDETSIQCSIEANTIGVGSAFTRRSVITGTGEYAGMAFKTYLGLATQQADTDLIAVGLTDSAGRRKGICHTVVKLDRLLNADDRFQRICPNGKPTVRVTLRGIRCYDVRQDSTRGGSGSHRADDPLTWTWTRNPALISATYLIMARSDGGCGASIDDVNWTRVAASANTCDLQISTPNGLQPRYVCDIAISTLNTLESNLDMIADTMSGDIFEEAGVWQVCAGAYDSPSITITDDWLAGSVMVSCGVGIDSLYNAVRVIYPSRAQRYTEIEAQLLLDSGYETEDGSQRIYRDMQLRGVSDEYGAQYLGAIELRRSRLQRQATITCNLMGLVVGLYKTVYVNTALAPEIAGVPMLVVSRTINVPSADEPITVTLTLEETSSALYNTPSFIVPPEVDTITPSEETPAAPQSLAAVSVADGNALSWSNPAASSFAYVVVEGALDGTSSWSKLDQGYKSTFTHATTSGQTWRYRVYAVNWRGQQGPYSAEVVAKAKTVSDGADVSSKSVNALLSNPGFEAGATGWSPQYGWAISQAAGARIGAWHATFNGATAAITNDVYLATQPGDVIRAAAWLNCDAGTDGFAQVRVNFYNASGAYIGSGVSGNLSPVTTYTALRAVATALAGTAYAQIDVAVFNRTVGLWHLDSVTAALQPASLDEVPDSGTYGRTQQTALTSGQVDLSKSGTINRSLDYISDTATYARARAALLQGGRLRGLSQGANLLPNPGFETNVSASPGAAGNNADIADGWYTAVNSGGAFYLQRETNSSFVRSGSYSLYISLRSVSVPAGEIYEGRAWSDPVYVRGGDVVLWAGHERGDRNAVPPAGVTCYTRQGLIAYDAADNQLTYDLIDSNSWVSAWGQRRRQWTVPAGASYVRYNCAVYVVNSSGSPFATGANLYADARFDDVYIANVQSLDDEIADGSSFARIASSELSSGVHKLRLAGSGARIGDQRNLINVAVGSLKSQWSGLTISYSAVAGSPATATISVSAGALQIGSVSVSYSASSAGVTGTGGTSVPHYLYYRDPGFSGGSATLFVSTNGNVLTQFDDAVYVGAITINFPTSGGGSGGGNPGGGACVACDSELPDGRIAAALVVGDRVLVADESTLEHDIGDVQVSRAEPQPCVRVRTASGAALVCSVDAPLPTSAGHCVDAACALGCRVAVWVDGVARWDDVISVQRVGVMPVQYLTVGNRSFWAREPGARGYILHHNIKAIP